MHQHPFQPARAFTLGLLMLSALSACASTEKAFNPKSEYPPDPWVKGYTQTGDCLGGDKLAAMTFGLPTYPRRAYQTGQQGWVIVKLDVDATGTPHNIDIERALPAGGFQRASIKAVKAWQFEPPKDGPLMDCRVLFRFRFGRVSLGQ